MARRAFWPTVETSEATLFARGILTPASCAPAPTDCCDAAPAGGSAERCCPDGYDDRLLFSALGPLGAEFSSALIEGEANWNAGRNAFKAMVETEEGGSLNFEVWCEDDEEFGRVWWIAGSYFAVEIGVFLPFLVGGLQAVNGLIVADLEVPGSDVPLTVAITHPCSELEPEGGSGTPSWSGGADPGGTNNVCGCTGLGDTMYVAFYGSLSSYGIVPLTYDPFPNWWSVVLPPTACETSNSTIHLECLGEGVWRLSKLNSGAPESTVFDASAIPFSCSPFYAEFGGTATGSCGGEWSAVVSEYDPSIVPPAGPPEPSQPNYCVNATPGGLLMTPKTDSSWWSDHAGSWTLSRVSSTGWRLVNPVGDVFFGGSWDGTGSHSFEGIYTVKQGGCP
jgi:hypothetical protein